MIHHTKPLIDITKPVWDKEGNVVKNLKTKETISGIYSLIGEVFIRGQYRERTWTNCGLWSLQGQRPERDLTNTPPETITASNTVTYDTGAVRSADAEQARYDLVTPIGLRRVAEAYAEGAVKYSAFNCEKGMPMDDLLNHCLRHIYLYLSGDRSEDHLGHAGWNILMSMHSEELWPHLNAGKLRGPNCTPPEKGSK